MGVFKRDARSFDCSYFGRSFPGGPVQNHLPLIITPPNVVGNIMYWGNIYFQRVGGSIKGINS